MSTKTEIPNHEIGRLVSYIKLIKFAGNAALRSGQKTTTYTKAPIS
jgi:hypothetical protein